MEPEGRSIDARLQLGYGSAWHLLRCLGWHREKFTSQIAAVIGATRIDWSDFNLVKPVSCYPNGSHIYDAEWTRLHFLSPIGIEGTARKNYKWPTSGKQQSWDFVGKAISRRGNRVEWVLGEAKAHLGEIKGDDQTKGGAKSAADIRGVFVETLQALGYSGNKTDGSSSAEYQANVWMGKNFYQYANRIACLWHLLHQEKMPARLVMLYFCGDCFPANHVVCPKDASAWTDVIVKMNDRLGLTGTSELEKNIHHIAIDVATITATPILYK